MNLKVDTIKTLITFEFGGRVYQYKKGFVFGKTHRIVIMDVVAQKNILSLDEATEAEQQLGLEIIRKLKNHFIIPK